MADLRKRQQPAIPDSRADLRTLRLRLDNELADMRERLVRLEEKLDRAVVQKP